MAVRTEGPPQDRRGVVPVDQDRKYNRPLRAAIAPVFVFRGIEQWSGAESNRRHTDFQSVALPTELPDRKGRFVRPFRRNGFGKSAAMQPLRGIIFFVTRLCNAISCVYRTHLARCVCVVPGRAPSFIRGTAPVRPYIHPRQVVQQPGRNSA